MPQYYNPYNFYPQTYTGGWGGGNSYTGMSSPQIQPIPQMADTSDLIMKWVEGEVGAKAFNMPAGWPANRPIPLWDSTDTIIWVKSWGPMGIPNPMQKIRYEVPNQQTYFLSGGQGQSGDVVTVDGSVSQGQDKYATKDDLNAMRDEIRELLQASPSSARNNSAQSNQNSGNNQNGSRGGNR